MCLSSMPTQCALVHSWAECSGRPRAILVSAKRSRAGKTLLRKRGKQTNQQQNKSALRKTGMIEMGLVLNWLFTNMFLRTLIVSNSVYGRLRRVPGPRLSHVECSRSSSSCLLPACPSTRQACPGAPTSPRPKGCSSSCCPSTSSRCL